MSGLTTTCSQCGFQDSTNTQRRHRDQQAYTMLNPCSVSASLRCKASTVPELCLRLATFGEEFDEILLRQVQGGSLCRARVAGHGGQPPAGQLPTSSRVVGLPMQQSHARCVRLDMSMSSARLPEQSRAKPGRVTAPTGLMCENEVIRPALCTLCLCTCHDRVCTRTSAEAGVFRTGVAKSAVQSLLIRSASFAVHRARRSASVVYRHANRQ